jgi:hypothetical protein
MPGCYLQTPHLLPFKSFLVLYYSYVVLLSDTNERTVKRPPKKRTVRSLRVLAKEDIFLDISLSVNVSSFDYSCQNSTLNTVHHKNNARPECCIFSATAYMPSHNALPGSSSVNTVQHATIVESVSAVKSRNSRNRPHDVFSVDPTDAPVYWLDSDHMTCVYCRSMSVPRLYK